MISLELVHVGWAIVVGCTKRQFQTANLLKVNSKLKFLKIKIWQVVMFQNVFMDLKILKKKQIFIYFSMSFRIFVSFPKKNEYLCLSNFMHTFTYNFIQL